MARTDERALPAALVALAIMIVVSCQAGDETTTPQVAEAAAAQTSTVTSTPENVVRSTVAPTATAVPTTETPTEGRIEGVLPNGDRYVITSQPPLRTQVEGISVGIIIDLDDGVQPLTGPVVGIASLHRASEAAPARIDERGRVHVSSGEWSMVITVYDHVTEALGEAAASVILDSIVPIEPADTSGLPAFALQPPLRWATDVEIPLQMQIMYPEFVVQRGCHDKAVACSADGSVGVVPLDVVVAPAAPWAGNQVEIERVANESTADEAANWEEIPSVIGGESRAGVFWTGSEVIVIHPTNGGLDVNGERWDPVTNEATRIAPSELSWRSGPAMVWAGSEVLVVGGSSGPALNRIGAAYDPATDTWRALADPPGTVDGWENSVGGHAVWTGTEMIVWESDLAYEPASDTWRSIATAPIPRRARPTTVWTGTQIVVWGGCLSVAGQCDESNSVLLGDGALYDVAADTWTPLPESPLAPAVHMVAGWTGTEVLLFANDPGEAEGALAAAFDPETMQWRTIDPLPLSPRRFTTGVWVKDRFVVWGGQDGFGGPGFADGAIYDPVTARWTPLTGTPDPGRSFHSMIDIGDRVYISGSFDSATPLLLTLPD